MISVEELEALDFSTWLQTGEEAARILHCNQSTISRRKSKALSILDNSLIRGKNGWVVDNETSSLLSMERRVHQFYRLTKSGRLRIHIPFWTHALIRPFLAHEVISNPINAAILCENVIDLLRSRVIDACILTPTQLKGVKTDDLQLVDLYRSRINLYHIKSPGELTSMETSPSAILDNSELWIPSFLPQSCKDSCRYRYSQLTDNPRDTIEDNNKKHNVSFMTPVMARSIPNAFEMKSKLEWPYTETLVFLKSLVYEPQIANIIDSIRQSFAKHGDMHSLRIAIDV